MTLKSEKIQQKWNHFYKSEIGNKQPLSENTRVSYIGTGSVRFGNRMMSHDENILNSFRLIMLDINLIFSIIMDLCYCLSIFKNNLKIRCYFRNICLIEYFIFDHFRILVHSNNCTYSFIKRGKKH